MDFQTPSDVCDYMASFVRGDNLRILEPTPGEGNLVKSLSLRGEVTAPLDFFTLPPNLVYDYVVMNPPFSPMKLGYAVLFDCMNRSDNIIALMPWLTLINGERRAAILVDFGLKSVTHLPRTVFKGSRVQTCILELQRGYCGETVLRMYKRVKEAK